MADAKQWAEQAWNVSQPDSVMRYPTITDGIGSLTRLFERHAAEVREEIKLEISKNLNDGKTDDNKLWNSATRCALAAIRQEKADG